VTRMESEPVGDGPVTDRQEGRAIVQTVVDGVETAYAIEAKEEEEEKGKLGHIGDEE